MKKFWRTGMLSVNALRIMNYSDGADQCARFFGMGGWRTPLAALSWRFGEDLYIAREGPIGLPSSCGFVVSWVRRPAAPRAAHVRLQKSMGNDGKSKFDQTYVGEGQYPQKKPEERNSFFESEAKAHAVNRKLKGGQNQEGYRYPFKCCG